jgi:hypothetical protein
MNHRELVHHLSSAIGRNEVLDTIERGWASVCVLLRWRTVQQSGAKVLEILYIKRAPNARDPYAYFSY